ncbi:hypothetical protein DICPUDRAFT_158245 [Dictyostelium purpureum]|uniref:RGS domain-containing protein n=1 Tax=Dictyostelium purpureum TaxID=5786 RepID=F1A161_DICPU|nr:uncharacterized protein DICPUDRAFT_158245 [Dictyostelium purpureum]EGC30075.1 hypothetical protein DICPUDRAFT_158245 [Dictyostelium purpureum]|eukprot:XP_003293405.1 hypothetical protein DICPUDRAFT_158245 [Dictyostelium purpureum]
MIYPNDVMNEVLRDEIGCDLFRSYLKTIYCSETLQFWLEIENFKQYAPPPPANQPSGPLLAFSTTPFDTNSSSSATSSPASPNNNNKSSPQQQSSGCFSSSSSQTVVRGKLSEEIDSSLFDDVQKVVYESLWMDCFPPFTHTISYQKYKQETGKCHLPEFLRISFKRKSPKKDDIRMKPISSK